MEYASLFQLVVFQPLLFDIGINQVMKSIFDNDGLDPADICLA